MARRNRREAIRIVCRPAPECVVGPENPEGAPSDDLGRSKTGRIATVRLGQEPSRCEPTDDTIGSMRVLVVTAMWPNAENPAFGSFVRTQVEALRTAGVDMDVLVLDGPIRKLIYPKGILDVRRALAGRSADLVHGHYGYCGIVARAQSAAPVIVTFHGDDVLGKVSPRGALTIGSRAVARLNRILARSVDASIVQTKEMASRLGAPAYIIPHEVDLELFHPIDQATARHLVGFDRDRRYVLFAASPSIPVKRYSLARDAFDHLHDRLPDAELVVVHREPQDRLNLYMNASDVLVFTSYQEGSPNIVKQAMACNLPIVSTNVGDVEELIGGMEGCRIVPPDPTAVAAALEGALQKRTRTAGRERVRDLATDVIAERVLEVYRRVLIARDRE